jgi:hypothetical protein
MRRFALAVGACVIVGLALTHAQAPQSSRPRPSTDRTAAAPRLPVRRVVLYKNGVGYFEHLGKVRGDEDVAIDFDSAQLDDVLKSMTVLDLGNGRVTGISYNSDAPLGQRLGALRLQIGDRATLAELFGALRGARLEVRVGERVVAGRLLGVERRVRGSGPNALPVDELTLISDAGEIRTMELTPATVVKLAERDSAEQIGSYLGLLASTRAPDRRRMTISTAGTGERDLLVSYVSEVPIWKTTYRIVVTPDDVQPLLQGWAIVDNTTGEDWINVELSLVAGAPQSFVERISQPLYARRPVVQPSGAVLLTPQTHEATLAVGAVNEAITVKGASPPRAGPAGVGVEGGVMGGLERGVGGGLAQAPSPDREAIASRLQEFQASATARELGDLFEYRVSSPLSIQRNKSALVPIISSRVDVERVSLWNGRVGAQPVRALWLTNSSGLTLDGGSFTVIDDGTFSGEGLVAPLKPQEKRLLSYAVDLGVQIDSRQGDDRRLISRVVTQRGVLVEHREQRTRRVYTIRNNDTTDRTVIIEHPIRTGWTLLSGPQPVETSATAYRFRAAAPARQTTTLTIEEKQLLENRYDVASLTDDRLNVLVRETGDSAAVKQALQPILAKKSEMILTAKKIADRLAEIQRISGDEQRVRENLGSLKGTAEERSAVKRYAAQLVQQEDRIDALRREVGDLERMNRQVNDELAQLIERLALDISVE